MSCFALVDVEPEFGTMSDLKKGNSGPNHQRVPDGPFGAKNTQRAQRSKKKFEISSEIEHFERE